MRIPEFCGEAEVVLDYVAQFIKDVKDMREARVDEVLAAIAQIEMGYIPDYALTPDEFYEANVKTRSKFSKCALFLLSS